jgi:GGDEF domain-containing protein
MRRPICIGGRELSISGSIGAAVFPDHGRDAPTLLRSADAAMYQARRAGPGNCRMCGPAGAGLEVKGQLPMASIAQG